jgi:hypothetical protein
MHIHNKEYLIKLKFMKSLFEFIFILLISIFLLFLFNPFINFNILINHHAKLLLFFYAVVILLNAEWGIFFTEINEKKSF